MKRDFREVERHEFVDGPKIRRVRLLEQSMRNKCNDSGITDDAIVCLFEDEHIEVIVGSPITWLQKRFLEARYDE